MSITTRISVIAALAASGVLSAPIASGGAPDEVFRCFGELTSAGASCVDWEADGSKRLVAHRNRDALNVIEFITPGGAYSDDDAIVHDADNNVVIDLRSTVWVQMPVLHISELGTEEVREAYWLLHDFDGDGESDPPRPGTTTATGPDGNVGILVTIRMTQAPSTDLDNPNKFYLDPNGAFQFCMAVGAFGN